MRWRKRYEEIGDIRWCPVHHGYLNEDTRGRRDTGGRWRSPSHRCDAFWWAPETHDLDCRPVAVYIERAQR